MRVVAARGLPWPLLLAASRLRRGIRAPLAAVALAVVACALLATSVALPEAAEPAALHAVLAAAPSTATAVRVEAVRPVGDPDAVAARVGTALGRLLGTDAVPTTSTTVSTALAVTVPGGDAITYLAAVGGSDAARIVDGTEPAASSSDAVQVAAPVAAGLPLGARLTLTGDGGATTRARVVGVYRPAAGDPFWSRDPLRGQGRDDAFVDPESRSGLVGLAVGPLLVAGSAFARAGAPIASLEVDAQPDLTATRAGDLPHVTARLADAETVLVPAVGAAGGGVAVSTEAPAVLVAARAGLERSRGPAAVAGAVVVALAVAVLLLLARLVAAARTGERELLVGRGASRAGLLLAQVAEAFAVAAPAALLGPLLALPICRLLLGSGGAAAIGVVPPSAPTASMWIAGGACAALLAVVLVTASLLGAPRDVAGRASRTGLLLRSGADLAVLVLGLLALQALVTSRGPVAGVAALAPVGLLVAVALASLRLLVPAGALAERLAARSRSVVPALAAFELARRSRGAAATLLVLVIGVGAAAFGAGVLQTWRTSQADQALLAVGAPARTAQRPAAGAAAAAVSRVDAAVTGPIGVEGAATTGAAVLALPPRARALLRDGSADGAAARAVARLEPAPAAHGLSLPASAGSVELALRADGPVRAAVLLRTGDGTYAEVSGGAPSGGAVRVALPDAGPLELVGVAVTTVGQDTARPVRVTVGGIRAGAVALPDDWSTVAEQAAARAPALQRTAAGYAFDVEGGDGASTTVRLLAWTRTDSVPAVVDRRLRTRIGAVADAPLVAAADGLPVPITVAAVVPRLPAGPTVARLRAGDVSALLPMLVVDRERLARALAERGGVVPADEWWLPAPRAGAVDAAGTARRLEAAPLGVTVRPSAVLLVVAGLLLAGATAVVQALAARRDRRFEIAQLRAAGAEDRWLTAADLLGALLVGLLGAVVGVAAGLLLAVLVAPAVTTGPAGGSPVPPVRPDLPVAVAAVLGAAAIASPVLAAVLAARADRRDPPATVLRAGEAL